MIEVLYPHLFLTARYNINGTAGSPLAGKLFVVIGAGGAGKALAYGAKQKGARVVISNRTYGMSLSSWHCILSKFFLFIFSFALVVI